MQILVLFTNQLVKRFLNSWSFFFIFKIINLYLIRILKIKRNITSNVPHTVPDKSRHALNNYCYNCTRHWRHRHFKETWNNMFWGFTGNLKAKWSKLRKQKVVPFHQEPEVKTFPRQQDNYPKHKRKQLSIYLISKVTIASLVKWSKDKLDMVCKVSDSILLQHLNEKGERKCPWLGRGE